MSDTPGPGPSADARQVAEQLRAVYDEGRTRPLAWRREQLGQLIGLLRQGAPALSAAMADDLGKPEVEGWLTDIAAVRKDIEGISSHLERWARPRRARAPWTLQPASACLVPEPLGPVLVIGPWNYPIRCVALPLAFALAAGNTAAVKPSELAPATSAVLAELMGKRLDSQAVAVVQGGPDVGAQLLEQHWEHIFFTGGARVGRLAMEAAARHLTPVTLELGGKNPAIVAADADVASAARRVAWGKFLNAGQTCVAPDFVLVDKAAEDVFVAALCRQAAKMWEGTGAMANIVNEAQVDRLTRLLGATSGRVVMGGQADAGRRYMAPTVVTGVGWDDALMAEEIFGPVLPVLAYTSLDEAMARLRARDKPLVLYVYTRSHALADRVIGSTSSGGVCVNHNAVQLAAPQLPFGGVGASGMGAYHGQAGFDTFSHLKPVLRKPPRAELALMYPPYPRWKQRVLRRVLR